MRRLSARAIHSALLLLALTAGQAGCRTFSVRPEVSDAHALGSEDALHAAEAELRRGIALEKANDEACIESYFHACSLAWHSSHNNDALACYNAALARLLNSSQRLGRLDPAQGLVIYANQGATTIPVVHHDFAWQSSDFQRLHSPPTGHEALLDRRYACGGLGLPLVVERRRNDCDPIEARFFPEESFFAATAVLRFDAPASGTSAVLEFYDPRSAHSVPHFAGAMPLATDLSAPLAKTLDEAPRTYFAGFVEPGVAATSARLTLLEPYQAGKVPVVMIHGLFSDPQSWADLINDLRAAPDFARHFQIWVFRYPTGQGFLQSAAALRRELTAAICQLDPSGADPALRRSVLIGHSMGGLIAKLQVTHSEEVIWSRLANRPLEEIITTEQTRALLAETCYFDPSPHVASVIFIASPHGGSLHSSAMFGRGAALLVEPSPEQASMHEQLMRDNPDTFNPLVERRFPTSIDMLAPKSPLLDAMRKMRLAPAVCLHNIVGVSHALSLDGPSDGVVSVHSASHPGCRTTIAVSSKHGTVHRSIRTSQEVLRILNCQQQTPTNHAQPVE